MIAPHLPALQVVLPLIAAPLCVLTFNGRLAWLLALLVSWAAFAIAVALLLQVLAAGEPITYALGGWPPPWGIEYRVDILNVFVLLIVAAIGAVVLLFAYRSVEREIAPDRQHLFYSMYVLCLTGLLGITITGDAFNIFVFLEISSLSTYALIAMGRRRKALTAAFQYLILGTIGATFYLIGIGMLYMVTGTLNLIDLNQRLADVQDARAVLVAFSFVTVGIALKLALFPLHLWLPNAYAYAPSAVSAFIAATATKVSVYVMLRLVYGVFGVDFAFGEEPLGMVLFVPALIAVFAGSLVAIFQINIKRMLAYSSVAQIGYIVLGLSLATQTALLAAVVHLFNHALMKGALFCVLGCIFYRIGSVRIEQMAGIAREMPWTMAGFVVAGLSLIGVPLTAGFISKWYLVQAALEQGYWPLAVAILLAAPLALIYVWRVIEAAYLQPAPVGREPVREAPLVMLLPTWVLVLANVYFGIETSLTVENANRAASLLLHGGW